MGTGSWLEVSTDRLGKPGIESTIPGLQGEWLDVYKKHLMQKLFRSIPVRNHLSGESRSCALGPHVPLDLYHQFCLYRILNYINHFVIPRSKVSSGRSTVSEMFSIFIGLLCGTFDLLAVNVPNFEHVSLSVLKKSWLSGLLLTKYLPEKQTRKTRIRLLLIWVCSVCLGLCGRQLVFEF